MEANKIKCYNCARIIEEDEVYYYFDGEGLYDVYQAIQDCEDPIAPELDDYLETTLFLTMPCPNCQTEMEDVEVNVEAYGEWDPHHNDETEPEFLGYTEVNVVPPYDPFWVPIKKENLVPEVSFGSKSLLIVAKTKMNRGFCYMGLSLEHKCFYRPIHCEAPSQCCWKSDEDMTVGAFYGFQNVYRDPTTSLPHKNNDLIVTNEYKCGEANPYDNLEDCYKWMSQMKLVCNTIAEIFPKMIFPERSTPYVVEGENSQSVGILKVKLKNLQFYQKMEYGKEKLRVKITDSEERTVDVSWTSYAIPDVEDSEDDPESNALILLGLARGWDRDKKWPEKRCCLLAIGLFQENS